MTKISQKLTKFNQKEKYLIGKISKVRSDLKQVEKMDYKILHQKVPKLNKRKLA